MIVILGLAGCAATIEDQQKVRIRETFDAFPREVADSLQAGELKLHAYGPTASDGYGSRPIVLPDVPVGRGSRAAEVAVCRAAVRAVAATPAGLYFRPPGGDQKRWVRVTESLCERGLFADDLHIGVPGRVAEVVGTDVRVHLSGPELQAWGFGDDHRGVPMPVVTLDPAQVDPPLTAALPWVHQEPDGVSTPPRRFVVPRGTRLQAVASCPAEDRPTAIRADAGAYVPSVSFQELPDPLGGSSAGVRIEPCGSSLTVPLEPVLSFRRGDGQDVDVVELDVFDTRRRTSGPAQVRVEPVTTAPGP